MKRPAAPTWKPARCADCGAPHPAFSRSGKHGPWRCGACDRLAGGLV